MGELIMGALICGGLLIWLFSSRRIDRETHPAFGVSVEGLAHQFKAVFESLEPDVRYAVDKKPLNAAAIQRVVSRRKAQDIPDDYGTQLVADWAKVYKDSLCFRIVVVEAIEFCVKDFYRSYGRRISPKYLHKQVNRVIPERY